MLHHPHHAGRHFLREAVAEADRRRAMTMAPLFAELMGGSPKPMEETMAADNATPRPTGLHALPQVRRGPAFDALVEALDGLCGLAEMRGTNLHQYKAAIDAGRRALALARGEKAEG